MVVNMVAGTVALMVIVFVLLGELEYDEWTAIAGTTIWCKFFASFILSRHAHATPIQPKKTVNSKDATD
jgi:hypothetical protein